MLIPKLNIDIGNLSQDMRVLKGGKLEKQDSSLIRTEISSAILIHVFTLTCIKVKLIGFLIMHTARI